MAETMLYSQQYNDFYHHDPENQLFSYHNLMLPTQDQKPHHRLSFSKLLQKRPSLMGRKLSIFSRQKKPQLKLLIPQAVEDNTTHLGRMDTSASNSTYGEDSPVTPTSATSSLYYSKRSSTISSSDLETAITTPTTKNTAPLMDYSGKGYSNFYIKLPNGNWMVRVRDGNRKIVGTYEIDGSMI
ncbi:unnamed protein product [Mucor hiemalis]